MEALLPEPLGGPRSAPVPHADMATDDDVSFPSLVTLAGGLSGYLALGACLAGGSVAPLVSGPGFVVAGLGAFAVTLPTLLVVHQAWGFAAPVGALIAHLSWVVTRVGRYAGALSPVALLYLAAADAVDVLFAVLFVALGALALLTGALSLVDAERRHGGDVFDAHALAAGWAGLTAAIGVTLLTAWSALVSP